MALLVDAAEAGTFVGGVTQGQLATAFGLDVTTVWSIVNRKTWRHLPEAA